MAPDNRPLSPHLQVYRPQLTSVLSICHRMSGVFLSFGTALVVVWLLGLAGGPESHARVHEWLSTVPALIVLFGWTLALYFHLLNGIRHLCWDAGWLLDLPSAYASGWTVVAGTVVLTLLTWGVLG